jgi:alkaline phosphatase D
MKNCVFILLVALVSCAQKETQHSNVSPLPGKIAFGSCGHQDDPQPVINNAVDQNPDLFIYLGDNIYSDTYSLDTLKMNYEKFDSKPEIKRLKATTPILATWDDHDYGYNDIGRHYPLKAESKEVFLSFFGIPDMTLLEHPGIYYSKVYESDEKRLQIIMLDMRTFRDKLLPYNGNRRGQSGYGYQMDYSPYTTADSTMLGETQWKWLKKQLEEPADLRIIGSSTQFGITHNGYEAWANFPHEQRRMLELIKSTKANGVMFITGDVHYAEISRIDEPGLYPIYDVTSSGITSTWDFATPNDNRIDGPVMDNHYGLLTIDWQQEDPTIKMEIHDVDKKVRISRTIKLSDLRFKAL